METLIVGLGNPGEKYSQTRHNLGYSVLALVAERNGFSWVKERNGYYASSEGQVLLCPTRYMNNSGSVVAEALKKFDLTHSQLLVIADDVHLPLGAMRYRNKGASGGHNGLRDIIRALGTEEFPRLRLGVGFGEPLEDYVLSEFDGEEKGIVKEMVGNAEKIAKHWVESEDRKETNQWMQNIFKKKEMNEK